MAQDPKNEEQQAVVKAVAAAGGGAVAGLGGVALAEGLGIGAAVALGPVGIGLVLLGGAVVGGGTYLYRRHASRQAAEEAAEKAAEEKAMRDAQVVGKCSCCEQDITFKEARNVWGDTWTIQTCSKCEAPLCRNCVQPNPLFSVLPGSEWSKSEHVCASCEALAAGLIKEAEQIEIFPATFKGAIPVDRSRPTESLSSDYHRSQSDAELQLRILCKERHFDFIFERRFAQKKEWDGNYEYKVWRASGEIGHKVDT